MIMKPIFFSLCLFLGMSLSALAQIQIRGQVLDAEGNPLPLANVVVVGTDIGASANADGVFSISAPAQDKLKITASFIGYKADTLSYAGFPLRFTLQPEGELIGEVVVEEERNLEYSFLNERSTETIHVGELRKAACCNLSESFETNPSVTVAFTDAVTGTKRIRMLGLDGVYSQILVSGNPFLVGPEASTGISSIPGPWISGLQIIKGPGSVIQGAESVAGQINLSLPKPSQSEDWLLDLFGSTNSRMEANLVAPIKLKKGFESLTMAHIGSFSRLNDQNKDGFLDAPLRSSTGLFEEISMEREHFRFHLAGYYLSEDIEGGTLSGVDESLNGPVYQVGQDREKKGFYLKTGYLFHRPATSLGFINQASFTDVNALQGDNSYLYSLRNIESRLLFASYLGNTNHTYTAGLDLGYMSFNSDFVLIGTSPGKEEFNPNRMGGFLEYTFKSGEAFSAVVGFRYNQYQEDGGFFIPRLNLRYNPAENWVLRLNLGRGLRYAFGLAENLSALASNRDVVELPELLLEKAWNFGGSIAYRNQVLGLPYEARLEVYHTRFQNQLIASREVSGELAFYQGSGGNANSVLLVNQLEIKKGLDYHISLQFTEQNLAFAEGRKAQILVPRWRLLQTLDWTSNDKNWEINLTGQWIGESRLPEHPSSARAASEAFWQVQTQATRKFKRFEAYLGMNNVLNYTQENPIYLAENPSDPNFDAGLVWGPLQGRRLYGGLRFELNPFEK